jgi:hypothetical protein
MNNEFQRRSKTPAPHTSIISQFVVILKAAVLPLLIAIYPPLFHYANNVKIVVLPSLLRMLLVFLIFAIITYLIALIVMGWQAIKAANAAFVFLIFFNLYGLFYNYLMGLDLLRIQNYQFLPFFLLLAFYTCWLVTKIHPVNVWKISVCILTVLIIINLIKIVPIELHKHQRAQDIKINPVATLNPNKGNKEPDIYFIIFDEMAGFDAMRDYWHYEGVNDFKNFLVSKGFFVAEKSTSGTYDTLQIMSERLNYQEYPVGAQYLDTYYDAIANNRVMGFFKSIGYSTVVFNEIKLGYPAVPSINADTSFEYSLSSISDTGLDTGMLFDDYGKLVADNTMLRAFSSKYNQLLDPMFKRHEEMVFFTADKIADLDEIPNPKFVYVHLLLPHNPFMFNEDGSLNQVINFYNWNYYLDNYKFSEKLAEKMIEGILKSSNASNPPIIIFQSDHGARNIVEENRGDVPLINYPEEYKYHIVNALYLPGYDIHELPQDLKPIHTFPIIMNFYFNTDIPLK